MAKAIKLTTTVEVCSSDEDFDRDYYENVYKPFNPKYYEYEEWDNLVKEIGTESALQDLDARIKAKLDEDAMQGDHQDDKNESSEDCKIVDVVKGAGIVLGSGSEDRDLGQVEQVDVKPRIKKYTKKRSKNKIKKV